MVRALEWNLRLPICFIVGIESPPSRRAVKLTLEKVAGAVDIVFLDSTLRISYYNYIILIILFGPSIEFVGGDTPRPPLLRNLNHKPKGKRYVLWLAARFRMGWSRPSTRQCRSL